MRELLVIAFLWMGCWVNGQDLGFECDESLYLVTYTESTGISVLYKVQENDFDFTYQAITLSEDRRLTSLAYNVLDKHLYALDVDSYELVKINRLGEVTSLGEPENIDKTYKYNSGTISPDGAGIFMIGNSPEFDYDNRFYTINLSRPTFYAGFLGVTGDARAEIHDFATDPLSGEIYGYDNKAGRLAQIGVGGQISLFRFPTTGVTNIDGLFFNQEGQLFAFSAGRGFYAINKLYGTLEFLGSGPQGTAGDACSCPYTSLFQKDISPRDILPCQEFDVTYRFQNQLGIGQTWVRIRDTFPEGFEIVNIKSNIVSVVNKINTEPNVLALDNLIYLMRKNDIVVTVRAPSDYRGEFGSSALHWDFPKAFGEYHYTDDPTTEAMGDPTMARIVSEEDINFSNSISYSCDGEEATISSPIDADDYLWSTGDTTPFIIVTDKGWYTLETENDCVIYFDSVYVDEFPSAKDVLVQGFDRVVIGETVDITATLSRGTALLYEWYDGKDTISCSDCRTITMMPSGDTKYQVTVIDDEGCTTSGEIDIAVEEERFFYAPTVFSPNNDGINDYFFLQSSLEGVVLEMKVYNRWGNEVFRTTNVAMNKDIAGWNGTIKANSVPMGVYIWVAELKYFDGLVETRSGSITVVGVQ